MMLQIRNIWLQLQIQVPLIKILGLKQSSRKCTKKPPKSLEEFVSGPSTNNKKKEGPDLRRK